MMFLCFGIAIAKVKSAVAYLKKKIARGPLSLKFLTQIKIRKKVMCFLEKLI